MSATPDSTLADPKDRLITDGLQRQLAASNAERDEALRGWGARGDRDHRGAYRSSTRHPAISRRCSMRSSKRQPGSAVLLSGILSDL